MKILSNQHGVALVTSLLLTLISLGITMALLTFIISGTKMSAAHKRYNSSVAAAYGGVEITLKDVMPNIMGKILRGDSITNFQSAYSLVSLETPGNTPLDCLQDKLSLPTVQWARCGQNPTTPNAAQEPDFTFKLQGKDANSFFTLKAKILDTIPGNSDPSGTEMLDSGMAVAGTAPGISPQHLPAMVTVEVEGTQGANPKEKADLTVLYAY